MKLRIKGQKYPTHHRMPKTNPKYEGSGALHDRFGQDGHVIKEASATTRGSDKSYLTQTHNSHQQMGHIMKVPGKNKHESMPGHTEQYMFREGHDGCNHKAPHGFRCYPEQPNVKNDWNTEVLRFSGNKAAHQIGKRAAGKFRKERYIQAGTEGRGDGTKGNPHVGLGSGMPGKKDFKPSTKHVKQPKKGSGNKTFPGKRGAKAGSVNSK